VERKLKTISLEGIAQALAKAQLYRFLREPEESESICQDILAAEPENQAALRLQGLCITDQFKGDLSDRYAEAEGIFRRLADRYAQHYYLGILSERRAKAQLRAGLPSLSAVSFIEEAMGHFEEAEKIRPAANEEAVLRWNRCVRLLEKLPQVTWHQSQESFDNDDTAPIELIRRYGGGAK
jgi:tetratricopeptide (TPR) repeat protein